MHIQRNIDLQPFNTLAVPATAERFCVVETIAELREALDHVQREHLHLHVLGGGSNVVLRPQLAGLIVHMGIKGREIVSRGENHVEVKIGAGENWHQLVEWCLANHFYGLEKSGAHPRHCWRSSRAKHWRLWCGDFSFYRAGRGAFASLG